MDDVLIGYAKETLTVGATAKSLTAAVYKTGQESTAVRAVIVIDVTGGDIRFWTTGDDPDPSASPPEGNFVAAGGEIILTLQHSIENFRAIRNENTDAFLQVTYERDH